MPLLCRGLTRVGLSLLLLACAVAAAGQKAAKSTAKPAAAAAAAAKPQGKSAFDKATLEAYVRHLNVWGTAITVTVGDPKPSSIAGFDEVNIHAAAGQGTADELLYVSKDGKHILRGQAYEIDKNPFYNELAKLKTEFQPSLGTPGAPVVLVLFSDFECPFCKDESKMLRDNLLTTYPKEVRLYFKDFPLEAIHPWAKAAAVAGRCIFRQNPAAFWDYHDWIYEHQKEITGDNLKSKVLEFGTAKQLDSVQLARCLDTNATESEVARSIAEGKQLGVGSTPTLFINGRRLLGQVSWPNLRQIVDFEVEYQKTAKNAGEDCGCEVKLPSPLGN